MTKQMEPDKFKDELRLLFKEIVAENTRILECDILEVGEAIKEEDGSWELGKVIKTGEKKMVIVWQS